MGITALVESKGNSNDNTIYQLHLLERNVLRKLEEQASILHLTALNDDCVPIVCAVDKKQTIVLKIDAVPKIDQVRQSLKELLRGNYLEELVVLLTEKLNNVLESAIIGDKERLFTYVVFANKSILRLDFFVYYRSFLPNESLKDYNLTGCEDYENTFARRIESDCTLRFGFKVLMKSISYTNSQFCSCIS